MWCARTRQLAAAFSLAALAAAAAAAPTLTFSNAVVSEAMGRLPGWGRYDLGQAAPTNLAVELLCSAPAALQVTNRLALPAGARALSFEVAALADSVLDGWQSATVTARVAGMADASAVLDIADTGGGRSDAEQVPPRLQFESAAAVPRFELGDFSDHLSGPPTATNNFSGCCILPSSRELLVVVNYPPALNVYDLAGHYLRSITLQGFSDTEGVCLYSGESNLVAVVEEDVTDITVFPLAPETTLIRKADHTVIHMGLTFGTGNTGIEGIVHDPFNDCFYAVKERIPIAVYRVRRDSGGAYRTDVLFDAPRRLGALCSDLSDLFYDPFRGRLMILSDESNRLVECDLAGRVNGTLSVLAAQPEGVAIDGSGHDLHIIGEPRAHYRYALKPPTLRGCEGTNLAIAVQLTAPWTQTVSAACFATSALAVAGEDYIAPSPSVQLPPGATRVTLDLGLLLDDVTPEPDEGVRLSLGAATNAVLGADAELDGLIVGTPVSLVVTSRYGTASPPAGPNTFSYLSPLTCRMTTETVANGSTIRYLCTGWRGSGSAPTNGTGASTGSFSLTEPSSVLWLWRTNFWLAATAGRGGTVSGGNAWREPNTPFQLEARTNRYYAFGGWSGSVGTSDTNAPVISGILNVPKSLTARFLPQVATNGVPLWWLATYYGPSNDFDAVALADTDGDGVPAWQEYTASTVPTNPASYLRMKSVLGSSATPKVYWSSVTGRLYHVYRAQDAGGLPLATRIAKDLPGAQSGSSSYTDRSAPTSAVYRVRVSVPPQ